ncbi:hypothetical protein D2Q93_16130 [Alicyclobacillaceae bacterium I2511]|nr:hypothetical protein D2Q93_16130 [Alicyclobacillaceae bacterium I2511]
MSTTGEEVGYQNAIRQITRSIRHRAKALEEACSVAAPDKLVELQIRLDEVEHMMQIVKSLHW